MKVRRGRPLLAKTKKLVPLVVMVPPDVKKGLEDQAKEDGTSTAQLVRTILESMEGDYQ